MRRKVLIIVGRDDWMKTEYMSRVLLERMQGLGMETAWEDPAGKWIFAYRRLEKKVGVGSKRIGKYPLRIIQGLYGLTHWDYFAYLRGRKGGLEVRCRSLSERIRKMDPETEKFILSYSSGSRTATLIADQVRVQGLICIGYPFRKRGAGDEPDRYRHLSSLRTSTLVVQGRYDEYGGEGELERYDLSGNIRIQYIDADHAYRLEDGVWDAVVEKIVQMIRGTETEIGVFPPLSLESRPVLSLFHRRPRNRHPSLRHERRQMGSRGMATSP